MAEQTRVAVPPFVAEAEAFHARHGDDALFSLIAWLLRCETAEERALVSRKIWVMSAPENTHEPREPLARAYAALLLLPLKLLLSRKLLWTPAERAGFQVETIDPGYFGRWFAAMYDALPGKKRLTPRAPGDFGGRETTGSALAHACPGDVLRLAVAALPLVWLTCSLSRRCGADLAQAARKTLSMYATWRGYFRRYPARHFVTYADELNAPSRWLAFRQNCPGELVVVQNGERTLHPSFMYGAMDRYFVFGERYAEIMRALKVRAGALEPVGALCLNEHHARLRPLLESRGEAAWDILVMDQSVSHNGLPDATNASIVRMLEHLGRYHAEHPGLRLAYQLRGYRAVDSAPERDVRAAAAKLMPKAAVLENRVSGDSYANGLKARLLVMFQSTIGFELMRLGADVLFVNFSGDPTETICEDARFQHEDPHADYARFARKLDECLARRLSEVPETAQARHAFFDGRVQERLAARLKELA